MTTRVRVTAVDRQAGDAWVASVTVARRAAWIARPVDAASVAVTVKRPRRSTVTRTARDAVDRRGRGVVRLGRGEIASRTSARAAKARAAVPVRISRRDAGT